MINRIVTVFKILPILVFIVVLFLALDAGVFSDNWIATGYGELGSLNEQVRNTMIIMTFVFLGIPGPLRAGLIPPSKRTGYPTYSGRTAGHRWS